MSQSHLVSVIVRLKPGVLDPQGKAVETALIGMGHDQISNLRQSKLFEFTVTAASSAEAEEKAKAMATDLLANTVIENFEIKVA